MKFFAWLLGWQLGLAMRLAQNRRVGPEFADTISRCLLGQLNVMDRYYVVGRIWNELVVDEFNRAGINTYSKHSVVQAGQRAN